MKIGFIGCGNMASPYEDVVGYYHIEKREDESK